MTQSKLSFRVGLLTSILALGLALPVASQEEGYTATFDWLVAETWDERLRDGLLTLNVADLKRFAPTGSVKEQFLLGPYIVENRQGIYYSNKDYPDTSLDQPASVFVILDDKVLAGAKGLAFDTIVHDNIIIIKHWNGQIGCSISSWQLRWNLKELEYIGSEYLNFGTENQCVPK